MSKAKQIVIIDNQDSFTYNLHQIFVQHPLCQVKVLSSKGLKVEDLQDFDQIVLSPGPDVPTAYPILFDVIGRYKKDKPILGVCLGHQCIAQYFGADLRNLAHPLHGQRIELSYIDQENILFQDIQKPCYVGLYHSWAVSKENLPHALSITALSEQGVIMGLAHKEYNICGIQFHPESYMSNQGVEMIHNWIEQ
ncbi:anthranilate synthase component II [Myroides sp. LJL115]